MHFSLTSTYGLTQRSSVGVTELNKIAIMQKAAIRVTCNASSTADCLPLANDLISFRLNEYVILSTGLFRYRVYLKSVPLCLMNLFTRLMSNTVHHSIKQSDLNFVVTCFNTSLMHNFVLRLEVLSCGIFYLVKLSLFVI
jgi:hypothetical protein